MSTSFPLCPPAPKIFHLFTDRYKFHELVHQNICLKISLKTTNEIDDAINSFINIIQTAAWDSSPKNNQYSNYPPSVSEYISSLIFRNCRARALYQRYCLLSCKQAVNFLENHLKNLIAEDKVTSFENYLSILSSVSGSPWTAINERFNIKSQSLQYVN